MKPRRLSSLTFATLAAMALSLTACDRDTGVVELIIKTNADGETDPSPSGSCILVERNGGSLGGTGMGPDYATQIESANGMVHYSYFIATEDNAGRGQVSPANGELAAEIDVEVEFFESGETKHVEFETYDGLQFDVYLWGQDDCEGGLPMEPPGGL